jgi:iron complex outermembrane receptor protein
VALFYYDVVDYQVEQFAPRSFDVTIANAPRARLMGAEAELNVQPATGWEFSGFCGCTEARLKRYTDPFTQTTVSDKHAPLVPEFNAGAALQYRHPRGLFGRIEFTAFGDTFYDAANTSDFKQSSYGLLSARAGYERTHFGVFLFAENLTDTKYFTAKVPPLNAGATGRPQSFGVMVTSRF